MFLDYLPVAFWGTQLVFRFPRMLEMQLHIELPPIGDVKGELTASCDVAQQG